MYKYKMVRLNYPGVFAINNNMWIPFNEKGIKFSFMVSSLNKGLTVYDPQNEIVKNDKNGFDLKEEIGSARNPFFLLNPIGKNRNLNFLSITEHSDVHVRTYYEYPFTEILLLLEDFTLDANVKSIIQFLNSFLSVLA